VNALVIDRTHTQVEVFDRAGAYRGGGVRGLHDLDVRLAEMDREGIAGEYVLHGDGRIVGLFFESGSQAYPEDVCAAGVRAYHRWLHDTFGSRQDRLFLLGAVGTGPCREIDDVLDETAWIADHGFRGVTLPGFTVYPDQRPLSDPAWEPFWSLCEARGLPLWVHGGYGEQQGALAREYANAYAAHQQWTGTTDEFWMHLATELFNGELLDSAKPRRGMWQLMFSGVFDRHPDLKLVMNEVRADWLPATLRHLDEVFEANRADLPAERRPSEYWEANCLACLSFLHRSEVELRHEIGMSTISFGRDYPHSEGTWPNTADWLRDALHGVPEDEVRLLLGENVIRILGLDCAALARIARDIGPTIEDLTTGPPVDPELLAHFDARGGYLRPAEGDRRIPEVAALVQGDLAS
jgi:predicted TIM-barrel fold metal-dependent hydrolase